MSRFQFSSGATSNTCMNGCMHCLGNSLKKLLHWYWSWTSVLLHFLEQCLSYFEHLTSSTTTAGLCGEGGESICPPFYRNKRALKPIAFSLLCRVQEPWLRQNAQTLGSVGVRPPVTRTSPSSPLCAPPDGVWWPVVSVGGPTCGMQFYHWKKTSLKNTVPQKSILSISSLGDDLREAF